MRAQMLSALVGLLIAAPLPAQRVDDYRVAVSRTEIEYQAPARPSVALAQAGPRHSTRTLIMAGLIGGAVGAFGGAVAGMSMENCGSRPDDDFCGILGGAVGFLIGEAVGVPLGINWVTNTPGKLSRTIPASLGITAGSLAIPGLFVLAIPAQFWTTIRIERKTS